MCLQSIMCGPSTGGWVGGEQLLAVIIIKKSCYEMRNVHRASGLGVVFGMIKAMSHSK